VADLANHRIDVYSTATGELAASLGRPGSGAGQFYYPSGLAIGPGGEIHVADMMNGRVQVLTPDGIFLRSIGAGNDNHGPPIQPRAVAVTPDREVFVTYAEFGSVRVFDAQGRLKLRIGQPPGELRGNPLPRGMAIATVLPVTLRALIPDGFSPRYYVWMSDIIAWNTVSLFAVGSQES
jgi:DNA-binding beta-propeller fold protein YncE